MKKTILHFIRTVLLLATVFTTGCLDNFGEYNHNPNETTDSELDRDNYLIGSKLLSLQNIVIPTEEHLHQFTEILVGDGYGGYAESTVDSWETKFTTFNPSVEWLKAPMSDVMTELYPNYRGIVEQTDDEVVLALAKVLRVAAMHRVTDQYGPIPYSKVLENKKGQLTVAYDSQQEVYMQMFRELDEALAVLNANADLSVEAFGDYDLVYYGNIGKWIKFVNSLKLRMAMRLTYVDEQTARTKGAEAFAGGVITDNADNAAFHPVVNRIAMIWKTWLDHAMSADFVSYLNGYNDPRRPMMITPVMVKETIKDPQTGETVVVEKSVYQGLRIGITPKNADAAKKACSSMIIDDKSPILWMTAAEVAYLRAEYELRWGSMAAAGDNYRKGMQLSFDQLGAGKADAYLADATLKPTAYTDPLGEGYSFPAQSDITPVWNDADDFVTALERIITQKHIAIFPLGNEAWAEYRRTGYPRLMPVPDEGNKSGGTVNPKYGARRIQYPAQEYSENRQNVTDAVQNLLGGPDNAGTRVWWDCRPLN